MTGGLKDPGRPQRLKGRFSLGLITDQENRVLFLKRAAQDRFAAGRWGLPGGGIEKQETPAAALARELVEELGEGFRVRYREHFEPVRDTHYGGIYELHLFRLDFLGGEPCLNAEHSAFAWVGPREYGDLDTFPGIDEDLAHAGIWLPGSWRPRTLPDGFIPAVKAPPLAEKGSGSRFLE